MLVGKPYISCVFEDKKEVSENSRILLPNSKIRISTLRDAEFAGELKNQFTR